MSAEASLAKVIGQIQSTTRLGGLGRAESAIFGCGLAIMTLLCHRPPIGLIPKTFPVATMWDDVINDTRRPEPAEPTAFVAFADGMIAQKCLARPPPTAIVATLGCGSSIHIALQALRLMRSRSMRHAD